MPKPPKNKRKKRLWFDVEQRYNSMKPRKIKRKKRSAKIKLSERFKLVHKNDATRVDDEKVRAARGRRAPVQLVDDNGANFKIKIRRKK